MSYNNNDWEMIVKIIVLGAFLYIAFILTSCTTVPTGPVETPPPPALLKADWDSKHPEWTPLLKDALTTYGKELLMKAPIGCEPMQFFTLLISTMSRYESGHKAETAYKEKFVDRKGNLVVSRGPLQVSFESCNGYGAKVANDMDLHDPATNFRCTVLILNKWVVQDGVVAGGVSSAWRGGARYWSVLRDPTKSKVILGRAYEACK